MANNGTNWSFGTQGKSGESNNLFGQNTSRPPATGLFGTTSNTPASSAPNTFGRSSTAPAIGTSLFGSSSTNQGSGLFGSGGSAGGTGTTGGSSQTPSSGFSFGQNQQTASPATQTKNIFGGGDNKNLFGESTSSAPAFGTSTPTSKPPPTFAFGNTSTTPAGPPPSNPLSLGLGSTSQQQQSNTRPAENVSKEPASGGSGLFGNITSKPTSHLFASNQSASSQATSSQPTSSIFSQPTSNSGSGPFENKSDTPAGPGLFGNLGKQNDIKSLTATSQAQASKPLFPGLSTTATDGKNDSATKTPISTTSLFNNTSLNLGQDTLKPSFTFPATTSKPTESTTPKASAPLFSLEGQGTSSSSSAPASGSTTAAATTQSASNFFGSTSKPAEKAGDGGAGTSTASGSGLAGGPASSNPFSFPSKPSASTEQTKKADPLSANATTGKSELGASTAGPTPAPQSRLKNKSMDEIITRWASDLSKYQKEFQRQAEKVAAWDRMLVENSDKIQKLYGSTLEAQRATSEVERQLTTVENEQADLERELDIYEKQVDEMIASQQGLGDSFQGPDGERQRMYDLAEKVNSRLDEMGKDLSSMIEEINDSSSILNKNNKPDDPLSQVVRILNSHLSQLQQIDQGSAALQLKVAAAQKASLGMGASGYSGPIGDAADGFYRSFVGRR